jgi:sRNA-binding protein
MTREQLAKQLKQAVTSYFIMIAVMVGVLIYLVMVDLRGPVPGPVPNQNQIVYAAPVGG